VSITKQAKQVEDWESESRKKEQSSKESSRLEISSILSRILIRALDFILLGFREGPALGVSKFSYFTTEPPSYLVN